MTDKSTPENSKPRLSLKLRSPQGEEPQDSAPATSAGKAEVPEQNKTAEAETSMPSPKLKLQQSQQEPESPKSEFSPKPESSPPTEQTPAQVLSTKKAGPQPIAPPPHPPATQVTVPPPPGPISPATQLPPSPQSVAKNPPASKPLKSRKGWVFLLLAVALLTAAYFQRENIRGKWIEGSVDSPALPTPTVTPSGVIMDSPAVPVADDTAEATDLPIGDPGIQAFVNDLPINMVRDSVASPGLIIDRISYRPGDLIEPSTGLRLYKIDGVNKEILFVDNQQRYYPRSY